MTGHPSRLALDRVALGAADETTRTHTTSCAQCAAHLEALKVQGGAPDFVHPSQLQLDRFALGLSDEATRLHAAACAQCAAHLTKVQVELPMPSWVRELESQPRTPRLKFWQPAFAFAAMAAVALLVVNIQRSPEIQTKGTGKPQAQVWVNRGGAVQIWDGRALHPEDAFRFEVRPGGYTHVTVVEMKEGRLYRVLHSAPVSSDGLSPAWALDEQGNRQEVVVLLLSKAPLSEEELQRALAGEGSVWSNRFEFPKEAP